MSGCLRQVLLYCIVQDEGKEEVNYKADHRFADLMQCIVLCCIKLYCIVQDEGKKEVNYKADHRFADLMQCIVLCCIVLYRMRVRKR